MTLDVLFRLWRIFDAFMQVMERMAEHAAQVVRDEMAEWLAY